MSRFIKANIECFSDDGSSGIHNQLIFNLLSSCFFLHGICKPDIGGSKSPHFPMRNESWIYNMVDENSFHSSL